MAEYFSSSYFTRMPEEYFRALDRETYVPYSAERTEPGILPMEDVGFPTPPMQDQVQSLKQRIFQGVSKVELGFMGAGKGSMQGGNTTPEMLGKPHREAIRDLAALNKIELSTHVTTRVGNLSGLGERNYSDEARARALEEIRRTIDFAADTTQGGAIVVHTGEFQRPISDWKGFRMYEDEAEKAVVSFVNEQTGEIASVKRDQKVYWPEMEVDEEGNFKLDEHGSFIPKFNEETGQFEVREFTEEDARRVQRFYEQQGRHISPDQAKLFAQLETQKRNAEAWGVQTGHRAKSELAQLRRLEEDKRFLEERWDQLSPAVREMEKNRFRGQIPEDRLAQMSALEAFDEVIGSVNAQLKYSRDVSTNYIENAKRLEEQIKNTKDPEEYTLKRSSQTLAEAAMVAMEKSQKMRQEQGGRYDQYKPLYISPENIFPESYGGHPEELKKIVLSAREEMARQLMERRGKGESEAKKLAEQHIKATFDIGHANVWRKYFKDDPDGKKFNAWLVKQAEELAKDNIIGHLHVTDNFGYNDEHLAPGEGNAPIRDFLEAMKRHGVTDLIVEGSHTDFHNLREGWREIAGSVRHSFGLEHDRWVNIENSYFGRAASPYFLYGDAAPNPETYQLFTQTRLE